jgi:hypothetical protein
VSKAEDGQADYTARAGAFPPVTKFLEAGQDLPGPLTRDESAFWSVSCAASAHSNLPKSTGRFCSLSRFTDARRIRFGLDAKLLGNDRACPGQLTFGRNLCKSGAIQFVNCWSRAAPYLSLNGTTKLWPRTGLVFGQALGALNQGQYFIAAGLDIVSVGDAEAAPGRNCDW